MSDETQTQSSEEKKTFDKMPSIEEFRSLDSETQKELMQKFPATQDQEEEKSEQSDEQESSAETTDQPETKDEAPETEEVKQEQKTDSDPISRKYKELEAEFTRRSQRMRELERTVEELKSKVKPEQVTEQKSPLEKLVETNPNAKELVDAIREEVRMNLMSGLEKEIQPIKERLTQNTSEENYGKFQSEVKEFLGSQLGKLEPEFNQVAAEYFESQDALLEAARRDPSLFSNLKKEVLSRHFVKAAKLMGENVSAEDKNRAVKQTGISGKAKTSTTVDDELDMKIFRRKSSEEMKKILNKHGAVKN